MHIDNKNVDVWISNGVIELFGEEHENNGLSLELIDVRRFGVDLYYREYGCGIRPTVTEPLKLPQYRDI